MYEVLGSRARVLGSGGIGGGAGKVEEVLGAGKRCKGSEGISRKVLGEWSRCLMAGQGTEDLYLQGPKQVKDFLGD